MKPCLNETVNLRNYWYIPLTTKCYVTLYHHEKKTQRYIAHCTMYRNRDVLGFAVQYYVFR